MDITVNTRVSDVAVERPATIKIFQQYGIDFCCGGKRPLSDACAEHGIDVNVLVAELRAAAQSAYDGRDWRSVALAELIGYIQERFHGPLRAELPRLAGMMAKVVSRHGDHLPEVLHPLHATLIDLEKELLEHMAKEDATLFPAITALEASESERNPFLSQPLAVMEAEHEQTGRALARLRELTSNYTPPEWACPTFRGLYYGLADLEREMHVHVHLENDILFPRAAALAGTQ